MGLCQGPWSPEEYQVLHRGGDVRQVALALNRSVDEVQSRVDLSFRDWYRRHRCPGSPDGPASLLRMARRLYEDDGYWQYLSEGELAAEVLEQARRCFRNFQPER